MIKIVDVSKSFGDTVVLDKLNMTLLQNSVTCVLGKSGCGKTTLLNILAGIEPFEGQIEEPSNGVSYIFQRERLLPNLTVRQNLQYVLPQSQHDKIDDMLRMLEIFDKADKYPSVLSGGQAQRVSMARAFLYPAQLLLMDEPFGSLDTALKLRLINAFWEVWQKNKRTVLFVTHNVEEAYMMSNKVVLLNNGKAQFELTLKGQPIRPYGESSPDKREILEQLLKL